MAGERARNNAPVFGPLETPSCSPLGCLLYWLGHNDHRGALSTKTAGPPTPLRKNILTSLFRSTLRAKESWEHFSLPSQAPRDNRSIGLEAMAKKYSLHYVNLE